MFIVFIQLIFVVVGTTMIASLDFIHRHIIFLSGQSVYEDQLEWELISFLENLLKIERNHQHPPEPHIVCMSTFNSPDFDSFWVDSQDTLMIVYYLPCCIISEAGSTTNNKKMNLWRPNQIEVCLFVFVCFHTIRGQGVESTWLVWQLYCDVISAKLSSISASPDGLHVNPVWVASDTMMLTQMGGKRRSKVKVHASYHLRTSLSPILCHCPMPNQQRNLGNVFLSWILFHLGE